MSASAGPQWNNTGTPGSSRSLSLFANLSAGYSSEFSQATIAYTRSSNNGYGVVGGAIADSVSFSTSRTLERVWLCALTTAYTQSSQLPSSTSLPFTFHTTVMGVQVSRAIVAVSPPMQAIRCRTSPTKALRPPSIYSAASSMSPDTG